ncbi:MAG: response regulator [Salegentibacter sp.]
MLKVLIIDDDDIVIFIQKKMMMNHGISDDPISFKKAANALSFLKELEEETDEDYLILLDINMPEMDGWQFLEEVGKCPCSDKTHVIMVTSSIDTTDKEKASKYPMVKEFVEKPISSKDCERIKNIPEISQLLN